MSPLFDKSSGELLVVSTNENGFIQTRCISARELLMQCNERMLSERELDDLGWITRMRWADGAWMHSTNSHRPFVKPGNYVHIGNTVIVRTEMR